MFKLYFCLCFKCIYSYYLSTFIEIDTRHKLVCLCVILFHFQGGYALFTFFSLLCFCSLSSLVSSSLFPIHSCLSSSSLFIFFYYPLFISVHSCLSSSSPRPGRGVCVFFSFWSGEMTAHSVWIRNSLTGKELNSLLFCACVRRNTQRFLDGLKSGACVKSRDEWYQTKLWIPPYTNN